MNYGHEGWRFRAHHHTILAQTNDVDTGEYILVTKEVLANAISHYQRQCAEANSLMADEFESHFLAQDAMDVLMIVNPHNF